MSIVAQFQFEASYGGQPFPMQWEQEQIDWIESNIPIDKWLENVYTPEQPFGRNLRSLALPQWPKYPKPKIGEFFYPIGASRWSVFRMLADETTAQTMFSNSQGGSGAIANDLVLSMEHNLSDPFTGTITTSMIMLPPMPLGRANVIPGLGGLYLVTLVDERYWWQYISVTLHPENETWQQLVSTIAGATGATITWSNGTPNVDYGPTPEIDSNLYCNTEKVGILLDALAFNVGCTVVRNLDGTYEIQDGANAIKAIYGQRPVTNQQGVLRLAGGAALAEDQPGNQDANLVNQPPDPIQTWVPLSLVVPKNVVVSFPAYVAPSNGPSRFAFTPVQFDTSDWITDSYRAVFEYSVSIDDLSDISLTEDFTFPGAKIFHDTAKAVYNQDSDVGGDPINKDDLVTLAEQIATDYYRWLYAGGVREVYPGIFEWNPDGAHDLLWTFRIPDCKTELLPMPWNFGPEELQHSSTVTIQEDRPDEFWARLTSGNQSTGFVWTEVALTQPGSNPFTDFAGQNFGNNAFASNSTGPTSFPAYVRLSPSLTDTGSYVFEWETPGAAPTGPVTATAYLSTAFAPHGGNWTDQVITWDHVINDSGGFTPGVGANNFTTWMIPRTGLYHVWAILTWEYVPLTEPNDPTKTYYTDPCLGMGEGYFLKVGTGQVGAQIRGCGTTMFPGNEGAESFPLVFFQTVFDAELILSAGDKIQLNTSAVTIGWAGETHGAQITPCGALSVNVNPGNLLCQMRITLVE